MGEKIGSENVVVCPRCGLRGRLYAQRRGSRHYYYVAHREGGRLRFCYVGPVNKYSYVERLKRYGLGSLIDEDQLDIALNALKKYRPPSVKKGEELKQKIYEDLRKLDEIARVVNEVRVKLDEVLERRY